MTVVPGYFERNLPIGIQTGHVIDVLQAGRRRSSRRTSLTMVLEPLSDNPDLFLRTSDQAYTLCRAVGSPACKILFDMYHMQRNEGRIIEHIDWAWDEIAYFQIGDVPGRKEPGTGEMNYQNIFKHIHAKAGAAGSDVRARHGARQLRPGRRRRAQAHRRLREGGQFLTRRAALRPSRPATSPDLPVARLDDDGWPVLPATRLTIHRTSPEDVRDGRSS